jgi:hypothetical protein
VGLEAQARMPRPACQGLFFLKNKEHAEDTLPANLDFCNHCNSWEIRPTSVFLPKKPVFNHKKPYKHS